MSFSLMIGLAALLVHLYLYLGLVRRVAPKGALHWALASLLAVATAMLLLRSSLRGHGPLARTYEVVSYTWIAIAVCMMLAVALGDLVRAGLAVRRRLSAPAPVDDPEPDPLRRAFITTGLPRAVAAGGAVITGYGVMRAFTPPEVTEQVVVVPKLPPALEGLSIVQLTDVHVGPFIRRKLIDRLVEQTNALRPDVVVITGDLVDGSVAELGESVAGLAALRGRFGTYFVTGNHDYGSGADPWVAFLERHGIPSLRNRRVEIGDGGGTLDLIGVDDWSGGRRRGQRGYDLDAALAGRDPDRASVLLAHQPANFDVVAAQGLDLQISGHTHGGQIFPMTLLVGLGYEYTRGLYRRDASQIYVSRGCGFWGPPARVGSPPELAKLILTARA